MKSDLRLSCFLLFLLYTIVVKAQLVGSIGSVQTNVPWRAGHAAAYQYPYVIIYGGSKDTSVLSPTTSIAGTNDIWAWDIRNGSWYQPTVQAQAGTTILPQIYFKATSLPSQGQIVALVSNTTGGSATGVLQKLDINSWSWSFPTTNFQASARAVGYSMLTVNNTVYTYGGLAVNQDGYANTNAVQNALALMDANSFQWSSGSNGLGLADHSTCYLKACDCLVTFGGTPTGNPTDVTDAVNIYDLNKRVWNVQGIQTAPGASAPGARRLHTATCVDNMMIVYGGGTNQPVDTDVWILNATSYPNMEWQRVTMANQTQSPNSRMGHSSVLDEANKRIYIYGGWGLSATNDSNMYVLDYANWSWLRVATTGYPRDAMPTTNATTPNGPIDGHSSTSSISKGVIAGIVVGSVLGLLLVAAIIAFCLIKKKKKQRQEEENNAMHMVGEEFSDEYKESRAKKDNPFYYNPDGFYNTNDEGYDAFRYANQQHRAGYIVDNNFNHSRSTHSLSKAWTGTSSPRNSYTHRSELGDSERVMTGVLEAVTTADDNTVAATHGSRSPRQSYRNSKIFLVTPTEYVGQGQVPNEIIYQKPNEFSAPPAAVQHKSLDNHQYNEISTPTTPYSSDEQQMISTNGSMELLQYAKSDANNMMNHSDHSHYGSASGAYEEQEAKIKDSTIPIDDPSSKTSQKDWNLTDSLSVGQVSTAASTMTPPVQYITPDLHRQNTSTSAQTWDTKKPLNNSIQHPSSISSMPVAQTSNPTQQQQEQ